MADISSLLKDKRLKELSAKVVGLLPSAVPEQQTVIGGSPGQEIQTQKEAAMQIAKNIAFQGMGGTGQASNFGLGQQAAGNLGLGETGQQVVGNVVQYGPMVADIASGIIQKGPSMAAANQRGLGQNIINLESKTEKAAEKLGKTRVIDDRPVKDIVKESGDLYDQLLEKMQDRELVDSLKDGSADAMKAARDKGIGRIAQRFVENMQGSSKVKKAFFPD